MGTVLITWSEIQDEIHQDNIEEGDEAWDLVYSYSASCGA